MSNDHCKSNFGVGDMGMNQDEEESAGASKSTSPETSRHGSGVEEKLPAPKLNGYMNGNGHMNGHDSDEEEYEIDIDPRMDMMMLEPHVEIIEEPDNLPSSLTPQVTSPRQPSIFRRKRVAPKPVHNQRRNAIESPKAKRRIVAEDTGAIDDRVGCRSLVCDSSGIIIAEMVYKCMICAHISDAISVAHRHYQSAHMSRQSSPSPIVPNSAINRSVPQNFDTDDDFEDEIGLGASRSRTTQSRIVNQNLQNSVPSNSQQYLESNLSDSFSDEGLESEPSAHKKPGNFVTAPTPMAYVPGRNSKPSQSILGSNSSPSTSSTRGGYVTCAVCNITKYYASVQRRYGQFTCMGCAKFFGRFLLKPKRYFCPNLGSCSLETSPRCKACLLAACINTYVIDERRMRIVNANRPIKKDAASASPSQPVKPTQHVPQRPQVTNPNNFVAKNQQSLSFAPPPLVKAPIGTVKAEKSSLLSVSKNSNLDSTRTSPAVPIRPNGSVGGRKGTGCRQCANCLADDCGKCNYCRDKPKFGGPNTLKKKCIQKKCLLVQTVGAPRVRVANK